MNWRVEKEGTKKQRRLDAYFNQAWSLPFSETGPVKQDCKGYLFYAAKSRQKVSEKPNVDFCTSQDDMGTVYGHYLCNISLYYNEIAY